MSSSKSKASGSSRSGLLLSFTTTRPDNARKACRTRSNIMAEYMSVEQARSLSGLRLVLSPGVPGPWSEAAKGIFSVKKIPYVRVRQEIGGENRALKEWTAQTTAPVAAWNDEPPRSTWIQQLFLAERLQPNPPLIPASIEDRVLMFGYC